MHIYVHLILWLFLINESCNAWKLLAGDRAFQRYTGFV